MSCTHQTTYVVWFGAEWHVGDHSSRRTRFPVTKEMSRRIPAPLRGYAHGAIRRVYLAASEDSDIDSIREVDHLWNRLEQMHSSLQENKEKATAAEDRIAELAAALRQEQAKNKDLQNKIAFLSSHQQSTPEPPKELLWIQNAGPNNSRVSPQMSDEQLWWAVLEA